MTDYNNGPILSDALTHFPNLIVPYSKCSPEFNAKVLEQCHLDRNNETRSDSLAGNISSSVGASDAMRDLLLPTIYQALDKMTENYNKDKVWRPLDLWINFQKKHEFNPIHRHFGLYSFVYWVQIPYDIKDELSLPFVENSASPAASCFALTYYNLLGNMCQKSFMITKGEHEGGFIIFPCSMQHQVYPFYTSDDERISISGNVTYSSVSDPDFIPERFLL
jgi:hypothetical protein|tara:strand:+ start:1598 stop:2260 length:663 start_codon:yes stop_codon:yes gene_type:complete